MHANLYATPGVLPQVLDDLALALGRHDVNVRSWAAHSSMPASLVPAQPVDVPGVFVCSRCDESTVMALQHCCAASSHQVLAVVVHDTAARPPLTWPLLQYGADDVLIWHPATGGEQLDDVPAAVAARLHRWDEIDAILDSTLVEQHLVGRSRAWRGVLRQIVEASCYTQDDILLHGESGTGKELATRLIHTLDRRREKRELIIVDCTTLAPELIGSELFGHERGAFTGAANTREGAFSLAHQGTLFLDEIGELPVTLQAQLLRVVQERSCKRLGGNRWLPSEFRLVCATHRDLLADVQEGRFRNDLYWRVAAQVITLPSLNERREDVLPLARHFMAQCLPDGASIGISLPVQTLLLQHDWPGNARQLRQLVARMCARHVGPGPLSVGDLPVEERPRPQEMQAPHPVPPDSPDSTHPSDEADFEQCIRQELARGTPLKNLSRRTQDTAIRLAVEDACGNLQRAACRLGVSDRTVQLWCAQANRSAAG